MTESLLGVACYWLKEGVISVIMQMKTKFPVPVVAGVVSFAWTSQKRASAVVISPTFSSTPSFFSSSLLSFLLLSRLLLLLRDKPRRSQ